MSNPFQKIFAISVVTILAIFISNNAFCNSSGSVSSSDSLEVFSLIDSANSNKSNFDIAINLLRKANQIAKKSDCESCIIESEIKLGYAFYDNSITDSSLFYFKNALKLAKGNGNITQTISILENITHLYSEICDFEESIHHAQWGINLADSLGLNVKKADFLLIKGSCYQDMGMYKKSTDALMDALSLYEVENDSLGISFSLINMGLVFSYEKNYSDAIAYTDRALNICRDINHEYGISACLNNLGDFYSFNKKYGKALNYFKSSLEIDKKLGDMDGVAICLNNIGDTYSELHDTILALSYYTKSLSIGKANNSSVIVTVLTNLGDVYLSKGNLKMALVYAIEANNMAELSSITEDILTSYDLLRGCYVAMGNYKKAYQYLEMYQYLYDSTYTVAKSKNIQEVISSYNDNKQKTEIINLKEKSTDDSKNRTHLIRTIIAILVILIILLIIIVFFRRSKISEKKQKLYYEKLLDRSEDFIFIVDKDGTNKYISPSYHRRIGRGADDRTGEDSFEFIHPDDIETVKKEFAKLATDGVPRTLEFRILKVDGDWICVSAYGQNLLDDPMIKGIVVNFWDITTRKKNELLIKKNELKFRQIFNAFPDIYFQADMNGVIHEITPSVFKITGYTSNEIIGLNPKEYSNFIGDWRRIVSTLKTHSSVNDFDTKVTIKNGSHKHCSLSAEVIMADSGSPIGIKGVIRDISNRIKSHEKLRKSESSLREANKSKELLFSIISHDLIGPIGTNKSIVDLIVDQMDEFSHEEIVTLITSLKSSLDITYSLIENLLSWARIQQERIKPSMEILSLNRLIKEIIPQLNIQAKRKSIRLNVVEKKPISVLADINQLDIVFRNLISNAIKFSNSKSEVTISISSIDDMAQLKIIDSGIGMTQTQIDDILLEGGSTSVRRGTDNEKGTGFGLIIVNEFVKNNGGKLYVNSSEDEGTTFIVEFPLRIQ